MLDDVGCTWTHQRKSMSGFCVEEFVPMRRPPGPALRPTTQVYRVGACASQKKEGKVV